MWRAAHGGPPHIFMPSSGRRGPDGPRPPSEGKNQGTGEITRFRQRSVKAVRVCRTPGRW